MKRLTLFSKINSSIACTNLIYFRPIKDMQMHKKGSDATKIFLFLEIFNFIIENESLIRLEK